MYVRERPTKRRLPLTGAAEGFLGCPCHKTAHSLTHVFQTVWTKQRRRVTAKNTLSSSLTDGRNETARTQIRIPLTDAPEESFFGLSSPSSVTKPAILSHTSSRYCRGLAVNPSVVLILMLRLARYGHLLSTESSSSREGKLLCLRLRMLED